MRAIFSISISIIKYAFSKHNMINYSIILISICCSYIFFNLKSYKSYECITLSIKIPFILVPNKSHLILLNIIISSLTTIITCIVLPLHTLLSSYSF